MEYPNGYPGLATQQLWNFCERSWETACVHRVRGKYLHINNVWLSQIYDRINRGVEVNCPISTTLEESVSTFANLLSDITMYSNSKHCHLLPWVGFIVIYPTAISAYGMLRRGSSSSESQMQTLCFDLSKLEHGQFGSRTISFKTQCTMATRLWRSYQRSLQQYRRRRASDRCNIEEEELLTDQQMKEVTYCKHFGTSIDIVEYQFDAPRYFERFLYDRGAARGECMNADAELDSDDSMDSMVSLCFDLGEYGPQTVVVDKQASPWFPSIDSRVTKGECKRTGQKLEMTRSWTGHVL